MTHLRSIAFAAALITVGLFAASVAEACVLYDQFGRNICRRPSFDTSEMARKTFDQMAADCANAPLTGPDAATFSDSDLAKAILSLSLIANRVRASGGVTDTDYGTPENELNALKGSIGALEACQYKKAAIDRAVRAFDSCKALMEEIEAMDTAAQPLWEKSALFESDWVRSLELFLPAAQACRNKLGRCFNPNNKAQTDAAMALMRLEISFRFTSNKQAKLNLKLPPCTKTMMDAKLYDRKNGTESIEYINTMVGNEFVSFDGEMREDGK